jgi:hypothetical protein
MRRRPRPKLSKAERRKKIAALSRDVEPPADIDEFRYALARKIAMFIDRWRGCPEPACRRHRRCTAPHVRCTNARPRPPITAQQQARLSARIQRALQAAAAQRSGT